MSETLTLSQIEDALHNRRYKFKRSGHTVMAQCPKHDGDGLNCQINENGYCTCYSRCGGFWIDEVFDELRDSKYKKGEHVEERPPRKEKPKYVSRDYYSLWEGLPKISERLSEPLKGVLPLTTLDELGWKWIDNGPYGLGTGVFIPYWSSDSDPTDGRHLRHRTLRFCQVRHLDGPVRFNFPKDAEPTLYGAWVLRNILGDDMPLFLCEGTSDWVTLWENGIPAIAMPSSSATSLICRVAEWCRDNGVTIVYAGDNDAAGDKLRQALDDGEHGYRICKPPKEYNDWTDFFIAKGSSELLRHVSPFVFQNETGSGTKSNDVSLSLAEKVQSVFPGAVQLELK